MPLNKHPRLGTLNKPFIRFVSRRLRHRRSRSSVPKHQRQCAFALFRTLFLTATWPFAGRVAKVPSPWGWRCASSSASSSASSTSATAAARVSASVRRDSTTCHRFALTLFCLISAELFPSESSGDMFRMRTMPSVPPFPRMDGSSFDLDAAEYETELDYSWLSMAHG